MEKQIYKLRAHHGLCLCFFKGKGYSNAFVKCMADIKEKLQKNPLVCISSQTDVICGACPNNSAGICNAAQKVSAYDNRVLSRCGLSEGEIMPFLDFEKLVRQNILDPEKRTEICGDCQWDSLCHEPPEIS